MKISEDLRARARYIEEHGFGIDIGEKHGPCCFICAPRFMDQYYDKYYDECVGDDFMRDLLFDGDPNWFMHGSLRNKGWTTPDAVAALDIAADYAEAIGK